MGLHIARRIDDTVILDDVVYTVDASFDNIIRITELMNSAESTQNKVIVAIRMLFKQELPYTLEESQVVIESILDEYVASAREVVYDLAGNDITEKVKKTEKPVFSLTHDADYIYAAFMQTYGIDLIEQQGKLHWFKFRALLKSLPNTTRFSQIVGYRAYERPSESETHHNYMLKMQRLHKLPDVEYDTEEAEEEVEDYG